MKIVRVHSVRRVVKRFINDCLQCRIRSIIISVLVIGALAIVYTAARPRAPNFKGAKQMRLVHLDLKGAPPKVSYLKQIFPLFYKWGATGLLIEYEDTFPYTGELEILHSNNGYSKSDIREILSAATHNKLEVIPLVQTFGHFEFVLKHDKFRYLREVESYPNALCPTNPESLKLVKLMLDQVINLHPDVRFLHIGSDEVWHLGLCDSCKNHMASESLQKDGLFVRHVHKVASYIKEKYKMQPIMWDDMFRHFTIKDLRDSKMSDVIEPMIWQYTPDLDNRLPPNLFTRYSEIFDNVWAASSFKGATGPSEILTDIRYHLSNHKKWLTVIGHVGGQFKVFRGFALTGWQRYDHYAVLCELLPVAIPSLAINLQTLTHGTFSEAIHESVSKDLGLHGTELLELSLSNIIDDSNGERLQYLTYPGSSVLLSVEKLLFMKKHVEGLIKDPWFLAGFNQYMVQHSYTNPYSVEHWLPKAQQLYSNYQQLITELKQSMSPIYDSDTIEEFYGEHIAEDVDKLLKLIKHAEEQITLGARTKDYNKKL